MDYEQAVAYISSYTNYEVVPRLPHEEANYDLRRVLLLLEHQGNPHLKAKSVHITGTNGKGSVAAMIAAALMASGYRTGLYISPHLHTWRERIQVNGRMISEADFAALVVEVKNEVEEINREARYGRLTTFEILTVLGFLYFARSQADFQVLEVGMGGRFDATSVIIPEVSVLTAISLEHTEVLGKTLAAITAEKAAIIKPNGMTVTCPQLDEVNRVIEQACAERHAGLVRAGRDVTCEGLGSNLSGQVLKMKGRRGEYELYIPLLGAHQQVNAAMAVAALEILEEKGFRITHDSMVEGLGKVNWPGRLQVLGQKPLVIVDGAHNPAAARTLGEALGYFTYERAVLVVGISSDKDIAAMAGELSPAFDKVIATRADHPRAAEPGRIADEFRRRLADVTVSGNLAEALRMARSMAGETDIICIAGSLFLVAQAIEEIQGGRER